MTNQQFIAELNKIANKVIYGTERPKTKGTSYWYYKGSVGNKSVCYTRAKTHYNGRYGFWSFIETKYKNKMRKKTKFALSATKKKAEARAERLLKELENN